MRLGARGHIFAVVSATITNETFFLDTTGTGFTGTIANFIPAPGANKRIVVTGYLLWNTVLLTAMTLTDGTNGYAMYCAANTMVVVPQCRIPFMANAGLTFGGGAMANVLNGFVRYSVEDA